MTLPAVPPQVTAELVEALPPRLRKRLDAAVAKLLDRPRTVEGEVTRIALDEDTVLELRAAEGAVASAADIRCSCLLAPACVHRAAAACGAPVADEDADLGDVGVVTGDGDGLGGGGGGASVADVAAPVGVEYAPAPAEAEPARALWQAAAALLEAGIDGSGAVLQTELLRAAHTARLAGLHRPAAAAVRTVNQLRAARSGDPGHRLAELVEALREVLRCAHELRRPHSSPEQREAARGTARRAYEAGGSLRLYGLCTEPVLTAGGHAGVVTWVVDAEGRLYSVPDVAPGGPARAVGAADRAVRMGDTALTHRQLARAGLAVSGATLSPDGRLGAGKAVEAVRAEGAAWTEPPLDRLWSRPLDEQVAGALAGGPGLLFLEATVTGTAHEAGGTCLLADCRGLPVRLVAAHDHPDLAYRDNLRALATTSAVPLRLIARLVRAAHPRVQPLAAELPSGRYDLGLDRLQGADLPRTAPATEDRIPPTAPLHLLHRRTERAVAAGRRAVALPGADDTARLRRAGLTTAADLATGLRAAASSRGRDHFGRLLPADHDRFAAAWLAAAQYAEETSGELCRAAWSRPGG